MSEVNVIVIFVHGITRNKDEWGIYFPKIKSTVNFCAYAPSEVYPTIHEGKTALAITNKMVFTVKLWKILSKLKNYCRIAAADTAPRHYTEMLKNLAKKRRVHIACGDKNLRFVPIKVRGWIFVQTCGTFTTSPIGKKRFAAFATPCALPRTGVYGIAMRIFLRFTPILYYAEVKKCAQICNN